MFITIHEYILIFVSMSFCFSVEGKLFPPVLLSKLRSSNASGSYGKIWMKYIKKRLETINMDLKAEHVTLFLDFCKYFGKRLFENIPAYCSELDFKNPGGIKTSVYGKICGSSEVGITFVDLCYKIKIPERQVACYERFMKLKCKYQ